jgi:hypothetical protein
MRTGHARLRALALMTAGAIGVHELRYLIGYDGHASAALSSQGHGYLSAVALGAALLMALALAAFAAAFLRARRGDLGSSPSAARSFLRLWLAAALGLAAIYVAQETLEGLLATGHPAGLEGIVGHGGWTAFALAAGVGLGVALGLHGADTALALATRGARQAQARRPLRSADGFPRAPLRPRLTPLATNLAGRAPPLTS